MVTRQLPRVSRGNMRVRKEGRDGSALVCDAQQRGGLVIGGVSVVISLSVGGKDGCLFPWSLLVGGSVGMGHRPDELGWGTEGGLMRWEACLPVSLFSVEVSITTIRGHSKVNISELGCRPSIHSPLAQKPRGTVTNQGLRESGQAEKTDCKQELTRRKDKIKQKKKTSEKHMRSFV